ncbi:MAG: hypothetical protein G3M78_03840 [Candidatus Nitrohelix vancouverensis]|uniref:Porin n=1 Tax=Candidatus Nitrohelix vancouverensis TaxID=2705534 RepID=A0A7T0C106_9BACT|nr:MAG: hypothetical protein G3M78_03840 [Candidatus Nitrohelix vancouverensis]
MKSLKIAGVLALSVFFLNLPSVVWSDEAPAETSAPEASAAASAEDAEDAEDADEGEGDAEEGAEVAEGEAGYGEAAKDEMTLRQEAQDKREAERKKKIAEAIAADESIIRPRRSFLDFNNEALSLGEPFLGTGAIKDYGLSWFGEGANAIRPRAQFYGTFSTIMYGGRINNENQGQLGYNLNFDFNFDLTNTERFHIQYRPFVDIDEPRDRTGGLYRFHNEDPTIADHKFELSVDNTFAWFEGEIGEMFNFIGPDDRFPTDYHIAVGLVPVIYQNSYLMNDNVLGALISKPNLIVGDGTNLLLQAMVAIDEINATRAGGDADNNNNDANLYGLTARYERRNQFWEFNYFHLENQVEADNSQDFLAASLSSTYGLLNYSGRVMLNMSDDRKGGGTAGNGQLYVMEFNHSAFNHDYYDKNYLYLTMFYGTEGWNDIAKGRTGRAGIFYRGNGVTSFGVLRNTGTGTYGVSFGFKQFLDREALTFNPEFSYQKDLRDESGSIAPNDQYALGFEVQYLLSNHMSLVGKAVGIHNEIRSEDWSSSMELRFKF